ncbi:hypothetical protein BJ875DRAFT_442711 [Amylocarpus encephaloides]|uniref:Uncharacterized protein n=1 Tax=Amylocarpus encephaloides TaxID=45428 RepID=A0A9P8C3S7_9HELO|nr:hypothetical protein BJ875DRAFT_442711 [Amylocarpus encephaloides]
MARASSRPHSSVSRPSDDHTVCSAEDGELGNGWNGWRFQPHPSRAVINVHWPTGSQGFGSKTSPGLARLTDHVDCLDGRHAVRRYRRYEKEVKNTSNVCSHYSPHHGMIGYFFPRKVHHGRRDEVELDNGRLRSQTSSHINLPMAFEAVAMAMAMAMAVAMVMGDDGCGRACKYSFDTGTARFRFPRIIEWNQINQLGPPTLRYPVIQPSTRRGRLEVHQSSPFIANGLYRMRRGLYRMRRGLYRMRRWIAKLRSRQCTVRSILDFCLTAHDSRGSRMGPCPGTEHRCQLGIWGPASELSTSYRMRVVDPSTLEQTLTSERDDKAREVTKRER